MTMSKNYLELKQQISMLCSEIRNNVRNGQICIRLGDYKTLLYVELVIHIIRKGNECNGIILSYISSDFIN